MEIVRALAEAPYKVLVFMAGFLLFAASMGDIYIKGFEFNIREKPNEANTPQEEEKKMARNTGKTGLRKVIVIWPLFIIGLAMMGGAIALWVIDDLMLNPLNIAAGPTPTATATEPVPTMTDTPSSATAPPVEMDETPANTEEAVVLAPITALRDGPSGAHPEITRIRAGDRVNLTGKGPSGQWAYAAYGDFEGWLWINDLAINANDIADLPTRIGPEPPEGLAVLYVDFPRFVSSSGASGIVMYQGVLPIEKMTFTVLVEEAGYAGFSVEVKPGQETLDFYISSCGTQQISMEVTLTASDSTVSAPYLFSFECR